MNKLKTLVSCSLLALAPVSHGSLVFLILIVLDPYCPGSILSWIHLVLVPFCPGSILSWIHFVLDPFCPGSLLSWIHFVLSCQVKEVGFNKEIQGMDIGDGMALAKNHISSQQDKHRKKIGPKIAKKTKIEDFGSRLVQIDFRLGRSP